MSHYTDAAVQAALEALRKPADYTRTEVIVRAVLEAVTPAIAARAWDEGHRHPQRRGPDGCRCGAYYEGECGCGEYGCGPLLSLADNPYRADEIERK